MPWIAAISIVGSVGKQKLGALRNRRNCEITTSTETVIGLYLSSILANAVQQVLVGHSAIVTRNPVTSRSMHDWHENYAQDGGMEMDTRVYS